MLLNTGLPVQTWPYSIWKVSHLIVSNKMLGSLSPPRPTTLAGEPHLSIAEEPVQTRSQVDGEYWIQGSCSERVPLQL